MEDTTNPGGVSQVPGGNEEQKNPEQQPKADAVSHDTFKKVLDEKKSIQARLAQYESKEREQLAKAGEFETLWKAEKEEKERVLRESKEQKAVFAYSSVASQFQAEAAKLGCKRPDALEKLVDLNELAKSVGQNYKVDSKVLKEFAEKAAKDHDYLFVKEAAGFRDAPPTAGKPAQALTYEEWQKLPLKEKQERMGEVMKHHSQKK